MVDTNSIKKSFINFQSIVLGKKMKYLLFLNKFKKLYNLFTFPNSKYLLVQVVSRYLSRQELGLKNVKNFIKAMRKLFEIDTALVYFSLLKYFS
jgi:hypothetical protein